MGGMRRLLVLATALLLVPAASAHPSENRPVAIVAAETANEVLAVSLGSDGGDVLKRVRLADPLMVAAPLHGPAAYIDSGALTPSSPSASAIVRWVATDSATRNDSRPSGSTPTTRQCS